MTKKNSEQTKVPRSKEKRDAVTPSAAPHGAPACETVSAGKSPHDAVPSITVSQKATPALRPVDEAPRAINRGLAASLSTKALKNSIWVCALLMANRFRVIRTIDIAACCFAERPYKAALTAAQRAVRGLVKVEFLLRYRSDRFQTIYGLSKRGVDWLDDAGHEASSSVRRVSDMTNPEHRLWSQFWVLACEARGLKAMTEQELLRHLNRDTKLGQPLIQGLLTVTSTLGGKKRTLQLRPDAVSIESGETTWLEVDRSKRGSDREASLAALASSVGRTLIDGNRLGRVVIFCKTERILKRAIAVINGLGKASDNSVLLPGRRQFLSVAPGQYAVWSAIETKLTDGRTELVDTMIGHIHIQLLPIWLPKVRIDSSNTHSTAGWFSEDYLPYKKAPGEPKWPPLISPLIAMNDVKG